MKGSNLEKRFYECLGVKQFEKSIISMNRGLLKLGNKDSNPNGDNYFNDRCVAGISTELSNLINKDSNPNGGHSFSERGNDIEYLKDFKKNFIFYSLCHIELLLLNIIFLITIPSIFSVVFQGFCAVVNIYCIMLQRYNNIRVNELLRECKREPNAQEPSERSQDEKNGLSQQKGMNNQVKPSIEYGNTSLEKQREELNNLRKFLITANAPNIQESHTDGENRSQAKVLKLTNNNF